MHFTRCVAAGRAACLFTFPVGSRAQTPLPPPPQIPYGTPISTEDAKRVAAAAIAEARRGNWSMASALVDTGGYLVFFERMPKTKLEVLTWPLKRHARQRSFGGRLNFFRRP